MARILNLKKMAQILNFNKMAQILNLKNGANFQFKKWRKFSI